jgi:hypothetical protein
MVSVFACGALGFIGGALTRREAHPSGPVVSASPTPAAIVTITPKPTRSPPQIQTPVPTPAGTPTLPPTPIHGVVPPGEIIEANRMAFLVRGVERPADDLVERANDFNPPAERGKEYVFVDLSITCLRDQGDVCLVSPLLNFKLIGSREAYAPQIFLLDLPRLLEGGEIEGGTKTSGRLAFVVDDDETDMNLMYETLMGTDRVFLALP